MENINAFLKTIQDMELAFLLKYLFPPEIKAQRRVSEKGWVRIISNLKIKYCPKKRYRYTENCREIANRNSCFNF